MDVAPLEQPRLPQHVLPVAELLEGHHHGSAAAYVRTLGKIITLNLSYVAKLSFGICICVTSLYSSSFRYNYVSP